MRCEYPAEREGEFSPHVIHERAVAVVSIKLSILLYTASLLCRAAIAVTLRLPRRSFRYVIRVCLIASSSCPPRNCGQTAPLASDARMNCTTRRRARQLTDFAYVLIMSFSVHYTMSYIQ